MTKTLIIGVGNLLMGDDGAGIHLIQKLAGHSLPSHVELVDGGVNSFAALAEIRNAKHCIIVDAMSGGGKPGDIYRMTAENLESPASSSALSAHDFSLIDSLVLAKQMGELPGMTIFGIEPKTLDLGIELSPEVTVAVDTVIDKILEDIYSNM